MSGMLESDLPVVTFSRKSTAPIDISVVAPCFNEEGNVPELTRRVADVFSSRNMRGELILVDDGSSDQTYNTIVSLMKRYPMLRVERHIRNRGIEAGWKTGIAAARGTYVCLMDADLQNPPEQIWNLYQEIVFSNADLVQGSRSSIGRLRDSRFLLSRGLNLILNTCFGMNLRDNKSGFVIAPKEVLADVIRHRFRYYYFQSFIAVSAASRGYQIREVETLFESRFAGTSFISGNPTKFIYRTLVDVMKGFVEFRLRTKRDNILADFLRDHERDTPVPNVSMWRSAFQRLLLFFTPISNPGTSRRTSLYYDELAKSQWLSSEEVRKLQEAKLRALIQHAYRHVPFYRERLDAAGVRPEQIQTLTDLSKIPVLDKGTVRANLFFNLLSNNHVKSRVSRISSSGCSDEPITFFVDKHQREICAAATIRSKEWTGSILGDSSVRLWQEHIGLPLWQSKLIRLGAAVARSALLPISHLTGESLTQLAQLLGNSNRKLLEGSVEVLRWLAKRKTSSPSHASLRAGAIAVSGQTLSAEARLEIESAFGCKVFSNYSSKEFSVIAHQCEELSGLHVIAESYIVEIVKDGRAALPGEVGEVVITDLNNYCMPLIRYKIGDRAVAIDSSEPCACGRGLPRIGDVFGKSDSIFAVKGEHYIPSGFFSELFREYGYLIQQFRVEQVYPDGLVIKIQKGSRYSDAEFSRVTTTMHELLGHEANIKIEFVEQMEARDANYGKQCASCTGNSCYPTSGLVEESTCSVS